jgi:hypothetical protein
LEAAADMWETLALSVGFELSGVHLKNCI